MHVIGRLTIPIMCFFCRRGSASYSQYRQLRASHGRNRIIFFNPVIGKLFPELKKDDDISHNGQFDEVLKNKTAAMTLNGRTYEMRAEPLVENGFVQGQMLWVLDMTNYFTNLELILIFKLKVYKKSSKSSHICLLRRFFVYTLIKD